MTLRAAPQKRVALDDWQPSGSARWLTRAFSVEGGDAEAGDDDNADEVVGGSGGGGEHHDVSELYRVSCLMAIEREYTGEVLRWADIETPNRLSREQQREAIEPGGRRALWRQLRVHC